jgi:VanZ family protein
MNLEEGPSHNAPCSSRLLTPFQRFLRFWLPVMVLCAAIFVQSAFPSPAVLPRWPHSDKFLHAGVYGLLAALLCRALNSSGRARRKSLWVWTGAVVLTTLYGLSDEWHQSFVIYRTADPLDLLADMVGAVIGAWGWLKFMSRFKLFHHPGNRIHNSR